MDSHDIVQDKALIPHDQKAHERVTTVDTFVSKMRQLNDAEKAAEKVEQDAKKWTFQR